MRNTQKARPACSDRMGFKNYSATYPKLIQMWCPYYTPLPIPRSRGWGYYFFSSGWATRSANQKLNAARKNRIQVPTAESRSRTCCSANCAAIPPCGVSMYKGSLVSDMGLLAAQRRLRSPTPLVNLGENEFRLGIYERCDSENQSSKKSEYLLLVPGGNVGSRLFVFFVPGTVDEPTSSLGTLSPSHAS